MASNNTTKVIQSGSIEAGHRNCSVVVISSNLSGETVNESHIFGKILMSCFFAVVVLTVMFICVPYRYDRCASIQCIPKFGENQCHIQCSYELKYREVSGECVEFHWQECQYSYLENKQSATTYYWNNGSSCWLVLSELVCMGFFSQLCVYWYYHVSKCYMVQLLIFYSQLYSLIYTNVDFPHSYADSLHFCSYYWWAMNWVWIIKFNCCVMLCESCVHVMLNENLAKL